MTADISNIVSVTISRETAAVSQEGFGTMLILGENATFAERVREYSDIDEVADDFATSDDEYLAAQAAFSQTPSPETVKIGRRELVAQVQVITFDADFVTGNTIDLDIDGTPITQVAFTSDHATTIGALATEIQSSAVIATAVANDVARTVTITAQTEGVPFVLSDITVAGGASQAGSSVETTVEHIAAVTDDLTAVSEEDDDWYGLILTSRTQSEVESAAAYIEAKRKIFVTCSSDTDILDSTKTVDVAYVLSAANYERTAVIYNETPTDFPDAAWMGRCFPEDPGSITWKFKTLSGITASDLTSTQRSAALTKNANLFTEIGGKDIMEEGVMASGEFIDVMRGVDYIRARMEEGVYSRLANADKIPYTNAGIAIIEAEIRKVLTNAETLKIIAADPAYEVNVPKVSEVSQTDKANRHLPDMTFEATLAGAVHKVTISGTVTV